MLAIPHFLVGKFRTGLVQMGSEQIPPFLRQIAAVSSCANEKGRKAHRVLRGGGPEGATALPHFSKCSKPFVQSVKSTLSYLKSCNPVRGTPSSTARRAKKNKNKKTKKNKSEGKQQTQKQKKGKAPQTPSTPTPLTSQLLFAATTSEAT